jgi:hypothetical protein
LPTASLNVRFRGRGLAIGLSEVEGGIEKFFYKIVSDKNQRRIPRREIKRPAEKRAIFFKTKFLKRSFLKPSFINM